jgi:hypothetical protein
VLCSHLCCDLLFGHNPTDRTLSASASRLWPFLRATQVSSLWLYLSFPNLSSRKHFAHWRKSDDDLRPPSADKFRPQWRKWRQRWRESSEHVFGLLWSDRMDVVWRWLSEVVGFMDDSCLLFTFSFWCVFNTGSLPK